MQHPPASMLDAKERSLSGKMAIVAGAVLLASLLYAPWAHDGPILCPMRLGVGVPCPSCGLTRSFCAMSHGHVLDATAEHLLGPFFFILFAVGTPVMAYQYLTGKRVAWFARVFYSRKLGWTLGIILMGYHLVRLAYMSSTGQLATEVGQSLAGKLWQLANI